MITKEDKSALLQAKKVSTVFKVSCHASSPVQVLYMFSGLLLNSVFCSCVSMESLPQNTIIRFYVSWYLAEKKALDALV